MTKKNKYNIGGEQLLLIAPDSNWKPPERLPDLRNMKQIALDTENKDNGLNEGKGPGWAWKDGGYICGISVAWRTDKIESNYFPLHHPDSECFQPDQIKRWLKDHIKAGVRFIMHNGPYDVGWIDREFDIPPTYRVDDTGCMAYMINENQMRYSLNALCKWRGLPGKDERVLRDAAACYHVDPKNELWKLPARYVGEYAEQDAGSTLGLAEDLQEDLEATRDAYNLEMDLLPMVHAMRKRGVRIDTEAAERAYTKFKKLSEDALRQITDHMDQRVSIDEIRSVKWLEQAFDACKISYPRTAKTGQGSFSKGWMKGHKHWLPQNICIARQYEDAAEKFIRTYLMDYQRDGRLHASVNQFKSESLYDEDGYGGGTRTYRFSYSDPPLQQIPHRNEDLANEIRGAFLPEEGEEFLSADFSQQEYRLIVHYAELMGFAKSSEAANRYREDPNTDFHSMVAQMTGLDRKPAKDCNFAKAYGAGPDKFAFMINKSRQEAKAIMEQYDEKLPFVKQLFQYCAGVAEDRGHIRLLDGARIHFDKWELDGSWEERKQYGDCSFGEAQRRRHDPTHAWYNRRVKRSRCDKAMNSLIQGGAARQTKIAMRDCWNAGHVPLLQVHDELCFSVPDRKHGQEISSLMCNAIPLQIPMRVDLAFGPSWAD